MVYYGWWALLGAFLATFNFAPFFSFGVFYTPLLLEFGWSKAQTGSIVSLATFSFTVGGFAMGWLADRIGSRSTFLITAALMSLGLGLASKADSLLEWYLYYGLMAGWAWGSVATVPLRLALGWFPYRRAMAASITVMGSGVAVGLFPTFLAWLIELYNWRRALFTTAFIFGGLSLISALLGREPPQRGPELEGGRAPLPLSCHSLWVLLTIFLLPSVGLFSIFTYLPSIGLASGVDGLVAAGAVSVLAAASLVGRLSSALIIYKLGALRALTLSLLVMGLSTFQLLLLPIDAVILYLFSLFYGLAYGSWITEMPVATAELFGGRNYGAVWGLVNAGGGIGGLIGPVLVGLLLDLGASYSQVLLIPALASLLGSLLSYLLWKVR